VLNSEWDVAPGIGNKAVWYTYYIHTFWLFATDRQIAIAPTLEIRIADGIYGKHLFLNVPQAGAAILAICTTHRVAACLGFQSMRLACDLPRPDDGELREGERCEMWSSIHGPGAQRCELCQSQRLGRKKSLSQTLVVVMPIKLAQQALSA
jgi:hypothetical protein